MSFDLRLGDCLGPDGLASLADGSVDALVTDPPAGIGFMGKEWDGDKGGRAGWVAWMTEVMRACLRVLKPGAHGLAWALPRTAHWTATALEDAGFEVRDVITHHFGSGFPKSLDVSKAIDARAGAAREVVGTKIDIKTGRPMSLKQARRGSSGKTVDWDRPCQVDEDFQRANIAVTAPATDAAKQWAGWGTALKPGAEHWILVRKPLTGTVAANVLEFSTGALNIDASRIEGTGNRTFVERTKDDRRDEYRTGSATGSVPTDTGRWPANVIFSHSAACQNGPCVDDCPVRELDEQSGDCRAGASITGNESSAKTDVAYGEFSARRFFDSYGDRGGASRFFYCAKPSTSEREAGLMHLPRVSGAEMVGRQDGAAGLKSPRAGAGRGASERANVHPTVKSIALMEWLVRLITPPRGLVLDPFAGSGTTGIAAFRLGHRFVGWEKESAYHAIALARMEAARGAQRGIFDDVGGAA